MDEAKCERPKHMTFFFVVDDFPNISETFILNQITGLIDLGHDVFIFSAARSSERNFHDDIRKYELLKKTYFHNDKPSSKFKRILWAIFMILAYGHRNPKASLPYLKKFNEFKIAFGLRWP